MIGVIYNSQKVDQVFSTSDFEDGFNEKRFQNINDEEQQRKEDHYYVQSDILYSEPWHNNDSNISKEIQENNFHCNNNAYDGTKYRTPVIQDNFDIESDGEEEKSFNTKFNTKKLYHPPWLVDANPLSEQYSNDEAMNSYRNCFCKYCKEFAIETEWAELKLRILDKNELRTHERSYKHRLSTTMYNERYGVESAVQSKAVTIKVEDSPVLKGIYPKWLVIGKQNINPEEDITKRNKFLWLSCSYCTEFYPNSVWGTPKLRECTLPRISSHEKSHFHVSSESLLKDREGLIKNDPDSSYANQVQMNHSFKKNNLKLNITNVPPWYTWSPADIDNNTLLDHDGTDDGLKVKRSMMVVSCCSYCAVYYPTTVWGAMRVREHRLQSIQSHEKSRVHLNSLELLYELHRQLTQPNQEMAPFNLNTSSNVSLDETAVINDSLDDGGLRSIVSNGDHRNKDNNLENKKRRATSQNEPINNPKKLLKTLKPGKVGRPRTRAMPPWYTVERDSRTNSSTGSSSSSTTSDMNPKPLVLSCCSYCAKYQPQAVWGSMKLRDSRLQNVMSHEKSGVHIRSVALMNQDNNRNQQNGDDKDDEDDDDDVEEEDGSISSSATSINAGVDGDHEVERPLLYEMGSDVSDSDESLMNE